MQQPAFSTAFASLHSISCRYDFMVLVCWVDELGLGRASSEKNRLPDVLLAVTARSSV